MRRLLSIVLIATVGCQGSDRDDESGSAVVRLPLAIASAPPPPVFPQVPSDWTLDQSARTARYGPPDAPALLAISCEGWKKHAARLVIVRYARADKGAEALFAIQGSKGILRLPVSAVRIGQKGYAWRGILGAGDPRAEVLLGNGLKATVPGGGELDLPAMGEVGTLVTGCILRQAQYERQSVAQTLPNRASNPETSPADR